MPIARFQLEDGRIARFEVPDGTTPEDAQALIAEHLSANPLPDKTQRPLPEGVTPSDAGAGRGSVAPHGPTLRERLFDPHVKTDVQPAQRRGGSASELRRGAFVATGSDTTGSAVVGAAADAIKGLAGMAGETALDAASKAYNQDEPQEPPAHPLDNPFATPPAYPPTPLEAASGMSIKPGAEPVYQAKQDALRPPAEATPMPLGADMAAQIRQVTKNPVVRGAAAGVAQLGQTGVGAVRLASDLVGADRVGEFAAQTNRMAEQFGSGATVDLKGNEKLVADVTSSIMNSAPALAVGTIGGPALRTLFAQSTLAEYNAGRDAGFDSAESLKRAVIMGVAEAIGERAGFPEQIKLLKSLAKHIPTDQLSKAFGEMLAKEIPGEQLTTLMQFLADKAGPAALNPNATLGDYLEQAGETLKVTVGQTAVMGGGPAALGVTGNALKRADATIARTKPAQIDPHELIADAINEAATQYGLSTKAAVALRDAVTTLPGNQAVQKAAKAFDGFERAGLTKKPGAKSGFLSVLQQQVDAAKTNADQPEADTPTAEPVPPGGRAGGTLDAGDILGTPDFTGLDTPATAGPELAAPDSSAAVTQGEIDVQELQGQGRQGQEVAPGPAAQKSAFWSAAPPIEPQVEQQAAGDAVEAGQPAPIEGEPINRNWSAFAPESGALGIPREQMPQIQAEHRGALVNFLNARGIEHQAAEVPADALKPTQAEFSPKKVRQAAEYEGGSRAVLVSNDGHILDGTHQWLAAREKGEPVKAIVLNAPIQDLLRLAHQFPSSTTSRGPSNAATGNGRPGPEQTAGAGPADAGAGDGTGDLVQRELQQPVPAGTAGPAVSGAGQRDVSGADRPADGDRTLSEGDAVTLDGKTFTVLKASPKVIRLTGENGQVRVISSDSANWSKIQRATAPATVRDTRKVAPIAEEFSGQRGEGMSEFVATTQQRRLQRERPELEWSVAEADATRNPKYKADRYVVQGRAPGAQAEADQAAAPARGDAAAGTAPGAAAVPAAGPAPTAEAARVARAKPRAKTARPVMGSELLGEIVHRLGGIGMGLRSDLSSKALREKVSKTGKTTQYTAWRGDGLLFRKTGSTDLTEMARVLEEAGYLEPGLLERDYLEATSQVQDIIKAEIASPGSTERVYSEDFDAKMRRQAEAEQPDPWEDHEFEPDDMDAIGAGGYDHETQALISSLADEAAGAGIDVDTLRERFHDESNPDWSQPEYDQALIEAIRRTLASARGQDQQPVSRGQGQGDQGRGQADSATPGAGSDRADGPDQAVRSGEEAGPGLTLQAETEADAQAKADREAAALAAEEKTKADEQARLAKEAGDRESRARAAQTVDDFQLGQSAEQQLSGQNDLFSAPAAPPATAAPKPIEDAGEKIGGARKDRWKDRGLDVSDLDTMSESEGAELATKANVWKPDYEAIAAQAEPVTAAMVKVVYDQLAAQPKVNTPAGRRDYVTAMQAVRKVYGDLKGPDEAKNAYHALRQELGVTRAVGAGFASTNDDAARRVLFSVYKGRSDPFVFSYNELARAKKLVQEGFPAKGEPWKRTLVVRPDGGAGLTPRGVELTVEEAARVGVTLTPEQARAGVYRVTDKRGKVLGYGITKDDAEATAKRLYEASKGGKDDKAEPDRPHLDRIKREGLDASLDRDVTPADLLDAFGFRGVEWGNWAAQDERQRILNFAYDALSDLAKILNVPRKALSLNGTMGMAFGARGGGRFAAHYEPGKLVINMTKLRGAGSLAHEWAHAFDHYLGELDKADAYQTKARGASGWMDEEQYHGLPRKRTQKVDGQWKTSEQRRLENLRPELAEKVDAVMRTLFQASITKPEMLAEQRASLARAEALAGVEADPNLKAMYQRRVEGLRAEVASTEADPDDKTYQRGRSQFAAEAQKLTGKSTTGYWLRPTEMWARAFEAYVFDKLQAMGARSEYLVHGVEADRYADGDRYKGNPYPAGQERAAINKAFDEFIAEVKTKETDKGVALFSQASKFSTTGTDPTQLRSMVDNIRRGWSDAPPVEVVDTTAGLPVDIQRAIRSMNAWGTVRALVMPDTGKVYLIADRLESLAEAQFALFHEVLGHYGLRKVLGREVYHREMALLRIANPSLKAEADAWMRAYAQGQIRARIERGATFDEAAQEVRALSVEEALADRAGDTRPLTGFKAFLARLQKILRRMGLGGVADWLESHSEAETLELLARARAAVERGGEVHAYTGQPVPAMSRTPDTSETYEARIDALFSGEKPRDVRRGEAAAKVLDRSDILDLLKIDDGPVYLDESSVLKPEKGMPRGTTPRHPNMLAEHWKKVPQWLDDPAAVFDSDTIEGDLVVIAPELVGGSIVMITIDPKAQGPKRGTTISLLTNAYDKDGGPPPFAKWLREGKARYVNKKEFPAVLRRVGLQVPDTAYQNKPGTPKILTEKNLAGYRRSEGAPLMSQVPQHSPEQAAALAKAGVRGPTSLKAKLQSYYSAALNTLHDRHALALEARQGLLDQFAGIQHAVQRDVGNLPTEQDPYIAARLANGGTSSVMRALLLHGQAKWAANGQHLEKVDGTKGLLDILAPLGDEINDWFGWMIGNRAARLAAEGRERNFTKADIQALQSLATDANRAKFQKAAVEYASFKRSVLDVAQAAGLINPDTRKAWDYADYIPFYRQIDDRSTFSPTGRKGLAGQSSGIRTLKGGEAALNDPMENLLMNFSRLIDASLKNNALRKTIATLTDAGSEAVHKIGYAMSAEVLPADQIAKRLLDAGTPQEILDVIPPEAFSGMAKMWAIQAPTDPDVVRVMVGGKPQFYRVDDPLLLRSLTSFVPFDFPGLGMMRWFKRLLTGTVTAAPDFVARNFIRDSVASQMIGRDGFNPSKSITGIVKSMKEAGGFETMLFAGASFQSGNINAADPTSTGRAMRRALRSRGMTGAAADKFMASVVDSPVRFWEKYRHLSEAVENANREAVFEAASKAGKSPTAAAFEAKDLMDFNLRGSWAAYQLLADVVPFLNARVQGLYRLGRTDPKRLVTVGLMMMAASLLLAYANADRDEYEALPDWDKDTYWHFWIGGEHFRLPKPFELGVIFATIPERVMRYAAGQDSGRKLGSRVWANLRDQLAFDPVPQMIRPALNVWANKDTFRDSPIENQSDVGKPPHLRYSPSTSETLREGLGMVAPVADSVGLSPKRLEYLVNAYTGAAGFYALALSDMAVREIIGAPPQPGMRADDIPVVKAFYRVDPARATVWESDLYDMREAADEIYRGVQALKREGALDKAQSEEEANLAKLQAHKVLDAAAKRLSALNKERDRIYADTAMGKDEKRQRLDELYRTRAEIARSAVQHPAVEEAF